MVKDDTIALTALSEQLQALLSARDGPTQSEIATYVGIDQGLVSRAKNSELIRVTARVKRLADYVQYLHVNMRKRRVEVPNDVGKAVNGYLAAGGDAEILVRQLELLRHAQTSRRTSRTRSLNVI